MGCHEFISQNNTIESSLSHNRTNFEPFPLVKINGETKNKKKVTIQLNVYTHEISSFF